MTPGLAIQRCAGCGAPYFPARLMCPRCHSFEFGADRVDRAVIEEVTTIRHVLAQEGWTPKRLAAARTAEGMPLTIGLLDDSAEGAEVMLFQDGTAPFGRAPG